MTRINTNIASLQGLFNLQTSNNELQTSLTRLSTGLQINSGADNPAGLIETDQLQSQLASINQSINNSNDANSVLSTADAGLSQISGLLNQIQGLVQAGLNSGALSPAEIQANQSQIDQSLSAINRISSNVSFAGDNLIDGSKAYTTQTTSADAAKLNSYQINSAVFAGNSNVTLNTTVQAAATKGQLFYNFVNGGLATKTTLQVSGASGSQVIFLGKGSSLSNIQSAISAVSDATGVNVTKTAAVSGSKTFTVAGAGNSLQVTDIRNQATNPDDATVNTQTLHLQIVQKAANQTLSVSSSSTATDLTLSVTLGTNAANNVTSTASEVKQLLDTNANSSAFVNVTFQGSGAGTVNANQALASITSGAKNGSLTFQSLDFGSAQFVGVSVLTGTFATTAGSVGGAVASRNSGTDISATINGQQAQGNGLTASVTGSDLAASVTFQAASNVNGTTAAITVTGGGSVFQIGQNATVAGQINIGIPAVNTATLGGVDGKLFELGSGGGKSLSDVGPSVSGSSLDAIITEAVNQVATLRGQIGSLQSNVIDTNIATLQSAFENITSANSQIEDTNFAQETSNLTRAQILSQSGISVLAIANQTPSQVLKLLQ